MKRMLKKLTVAILAASLSILLLPSIPAAMASTIESESNNAAGVSAASFYNEEVERLSDNSIVIEAGTTEALLYVTTGSANVKITDIRSSDTSIVAIEDYEIENDASEGDEYGNVAEIYLQKKKSGSANIIAYFSDGTTKSCKVTCNYSELSLDKTNITFSKKYPYTQEAVMLTDLGEADYAGIASAKSSNPAVASVMIGGYNDAEGANYFITITAKKPGKTTIKVTDYAGRSRNVSVTVKKSWRKANLKNNSYARLYCGDRKVYVSSKTGTKVTVSIGGRHYSKKIGKKGYTYIKVGRTYKYKTNYRVKFRYNGASVTKKYKVSTDTYARFGHIMSCKTYVPVTVYNATKGDTVILTAGGKNYKHRITYSGTYTHTFYTKKSTGNYYSLTVSVKNKYKQTLYSYTWWPW